MGLNVRSGAHKMPVQDIARYMTKLGFETAGCSSCEHGSQLNVAAFSTYEAYLKF